MELKMDLASLKATADGGGLVRHPAAIESALTRFARLPFSQLFHPATRIARPQIVDELLSKAVPDCSRTPDDLRIGDVLTCLDSHDADPSDPAYDPDYANAFFDLTLLPSRFLPPIRITPPPSKGGAAALRSQDPAPKPPTLDEVRKKMCCIDARGLSPTQIQGGLMQVGLTAYFRYLQQIDPTGAFDVHFASIEPFLLRRSKRTTLRLPDDIERMSLGQALLLVLDFFIHPEDYALGQDADFHACWLTDMLLVEPLHGLARAGLFDREVLAAPHTAPEPSFDDYIEPLDEDVLDFEAFDDDPPDIPLSASELDALFGSTPPPRSAK